MTKKEHAVNKLPSRILGTDLSQDKFLFPTGAEFVCIINKQGRIESSYNNGMNIPKEKKEMFSMGLQLQDSMQSDFNDEFGPVDYTITERKNSRFVSIPTSEGILLAKLDKSTDPFLFINKILEIMNFSKRLFETTGVYQ